MTLATSDARRGPAGQPSRQDRRTGVGNRVQFEALVEVGAGSTGGFEAESVDVSPEGMRLRTAYMPEPGERLVCRFDGLGGDVVAEGEVIWCAEQGRGGEFGVRFTRLDQKAITLLQQMCISEQAEQPAADNGSVGPGARVRLHIQGLGSPMRARVRDAAPGEVLIGSNLEFLRVGRDVQLEDVDGGRTQVAQIEHVDVAVDPETHIPQLIVALRYEGFAADEAEMEPPDQTTAPVRVARKVAAPKVAMQAVAETTPEPTVIDEDDQTERAPTSDGVMAADDGPSAELGGAADDRLDPAVHYSAGDAEPGIDEAEYDTAQQAQAEPLAAAPRRRRPAAGPSRADEVSAAASADPATRLAGAKAKLSETVSRVGPAIGKLGPVFAGAARGTSAALSRVFARVKERREAARAQKQGAKPAGPVRTTAPPPSGALRSDGRRLFRTKQPAPSPDAPVLKGGDRKRTAFGIVLGLLAVAAIYGVAHKVSAWQRAQDGPTPALSKPAALAAGDPAVDAPLGADPAGAPIATANIPLFGPTPLSTTEPVPVPEGLDEAMAGDGAEEPGASGAGAEEDAKPLTTDKEWGVGSVEKPTVLKLKMDGAIDGIAGTEGATGFTLVVPSRKSISSAAGLARKDKRIESVNVVNFPDRCEVTVHFKSDVPAFLARTKDKYLIIEVGADTKDGNDDLEVSSTEKSSKKKSSTKKSSKKKSSSTKPDTQKSDGKGDAKKSSTKSGSSNKDAAEPASKSSKGKGKAKK